MWTRKDIKGRAKEVLKTNYWKAFIVSLVLVLAGTHQNGGGGGGRNHSDGWTFNFHDGIPELIWAIIAIAASVAIFIIVLRILIGYALEVGGRKFFISAAQGETNMGYLGYSFQEGRYFNILVTMLLRSIYTLLWTLLLIIPGIIKAYSYRMVPYILADSPSIGHNRAIQLSKEMTHGHKLDMFILDLSFLGWYLLGAIAFGIGILFVHPYADATNAELYLMLRKNALERGIASHGELNIGYIIE